MRATAFLSCLVLFSCLAASAGSAAPGAARDGALVRIGQGELLGHPDRLGTMAWKGIPYAAPPVGALRWKAPRDPSPWTGIRDARNFGQASFQQRPLVGGVMGSEDCLYLNVWRPAGDGERLPVYVFLHGGGNTTGSANFVDDYLGWGVAGKSGLVFVSVNYRLGPMGWLLLPGGAGAAGSTDATAGPGATAGQGKVGPPDAGRMADDASGNFGTLDIIKALEWIRDNIEAFGGDPSRVTVAGESAGAINVLSLLLSPRASGLFHRAVSESGAPSSVSREEAEDATRGLAASLLVATRRAATRAIALEEVRKMSPAELEVLLRGADAKTLVGLGKGNAMGMSGWPTLIRDGAVIPAKGFDAFDEGSWPNRVPLVIGTNKDELKLFLSFDRSLGWRDPLYQALGRFGSLSWKASGADGIADAVARHGGEAWLYRFDWGSPGASGSSPEPGDWGRRLGAFHTSEISFFLGTDTCLGPFLTWLLFTRANLPGREALSRDIMAYLASFAATGDPNAARKDGTGPGLPAWPRRPADSAAAAAAGEGVGLSFDADLSVSHIAPLRAVVTRQGVLDAIDAELEPALAAAVKARLWWK